MSPQAWKYIMNRDSYTKIEAPDSHDAKEMLNICFGKDSSLRKELLIDQDGEAPSSKSVRATSTKRSTQKKTTKKSTKVKTSKKTAKKAAKKKKKTTKKK